jgi:hypothetical protein
VVNQEGLSGAVIENRKALLVMIVSYNSSIAGSAAGMDDLNLALATGFDESDFGEIDWLTGVLDHEGSVNLLASDYGRSVQNEAGRNVRCGGRGRTRHPRPEPRPNHQHGG